MNSRAKDKAGQRVDWIELSSLTYAKRKIEIEGRLGSNALRRVAHCRERIASVVEEVVVDTDSSAEDPFEESRKVSLQLRSWQVLHDFSRLIWRREDFAVDLPQQCPLNAVSCSFVQYAAMCLIGW